MKRGTITRGLSVALHQLVWVYSKWLLLVACIIYTFSGVYKIEGNSVGVLTRFGKVVDPRVPPGLHYKLPYPVDTVHIVPIKQIKTLEISDFNTRFRQSNGGIAYAFHKSTSLEPYCLTGDNNLIAITLVLKYTIGEPVHYLFGMKQPEYFMERCAADLVVHKLAKMKIDEALTFGKKQLELEIQSSLVAKLEEYKTGIHLSFLEIKEITPPTKVQKEFDKVINAEVEKKKTHNQAQGYYNRVVPEARSEANEVIQKARAYKNEKISQAEGESSRFLARFEGYNSNKEALREKIYLDFMQEIYPKLGEVRVINSTKEQSPTFIPLSAK